MLEQQCGECGYWRHPKRRVRSGTEGNISDGFEPVPRRGVAKGVKAEQSAACVYRI